MKAPLAVAAIMAAAMAVAALAVFGLGDAATLVPPPEAVAEGFMRSMATHRYAQAMPYLTPPLRTIGLEGLRRRQEEIERACGRVRDVRGVERRRSGESARAVAVLRAEKGDASVWFDLVREHGEWRLASLGELDGRQTP